MVADDHTLRIYVWHKQNLVAHRNQSTYHTHKWKYPKTSDKFKINMVVTLYVIGRKLHFVLSHTNKYPLFFFLTRLTHLFLLVALCLLCTLTFFSSPVLFHPAVIRHYFRIMFECRSEGVGIIPSRSTPAEITITIRVFRLSNLQLLLRCDARGCFAKCITGRKE